MTFKDITTELESADKPVVKMLRKGKDIQVLGIGFKKGMILTKHKTGIPARLLVIKSEVVYHRDQDSTPLALYDEHEIEVDEMHWVTANEDSLIMVIKGR